MGYKWIAISGSTFDRSLPIKKIRFYMKNIPEGTPMYSVTEGCFSEFPNKNTDGAASSTYDQPSYGYPRYHKFNMVYMGGKYVNNWDHNSRQENNITSLPLIETGVYELDVTDSGLLYWSGIEDAENSPIYNNGNLIYVYAKNSFEPSKSVFNFRSVGGTDTFTLEAESNWTATTESNWVSLSSMTGSTGGSITLTCNRNNTESARTAIITFTNADGDTFNITVNQKRGTAENIVNKMYKNGSLIYQNQIFTTKLSVSENSITFQKTGGTKDIAVKSNVPYTCSSNAEWISISTGTSGIQVTVAEYSGTTERTGTITITANNAGDIVTKTISVVQKVIGYVSYIHSASIASQSRERINTGIYPTTATTFRVVGQSKALPAGGEVVGFDERDTYDWTDYRLFWYRNGGDVLSFDYNDQRNTNETWGGAYDGRIIDLTASNYKVFDNISETYLITGTTQSSQSTTNVPIYVNVGAWWLKLLQIWQGDELVFDGEAAVIDGNVGLYDRVSETLKYNPDLTMGYEQ